MSDELPYIVHAQQKNGLKEGGTEGKAHGSATVKEILKHEKLHLHFPNSDRVYFCNARPVEPHTTLSQLPPRPTLCVGTTNIPLSVVKPDEGKRKEDKAWLVINVDRAHLPGAPDRKVTVGYVEKMPEDADGAAAAQLADTCAKYVVFHVDKEYVSEHPGGGQILLDAGACYMPPPHVVFASFLLYACSCPSPFSYPFHPFARTPAALQQRTPQSRSIPWGTRRAQKNTCGSTPLACCARRTQKRWPRTLGRSRMAPP